LSYRLVGKLIGGRAYHYAVRSGPVKGKPSNVDQVDLGQIDDLVPRGQVALTPGKTRHWRAGGQPSGSWQGIWIWPPPSDPRCPQPSSHTPSVGTALVLAAVNRVGSPRSKRGFAEW